MNRPISVLSRHWQSLLVFNLLVIAFAILGIKISPKTWGSQAQLIIANTDSNLNADLGTLGSLDGGQVKFSTSLNPLNAQQSILTGNAIMEKLLAIDPEREEFSKLDKYKDLFEIEIADKSTTMSLNVLGSSPELATQRAKNWIDIYQQRLHELRKQESTTRNGLSQEELTIAEQNLANAQRALAQFEKASGLVSSEEQTRGLVGTIDKLTAAKIQAETKAAANEKKVAILSSRLSMTPAQAINLVSLSEDLNYQAVRKELQEVEIALGNLLTHRTEADPQVRDLQLRRDKLRQQYQRYIKQTADSVRVDLAVSNNSGRTALIQQLIMAETEAEAQRREANKLEDKIAQLRATLVGIPANKSNLLRLQKDKDVAEGVYKGLIAKIQQTKIDAFNTYPQVEVLEPPSSSSEPVSPNAMLMSLNALLASIVGSIAIIILLEKRNPLFKTNDLNSCNLPIVGYIRQFKFLGKSDRNPEALLNLMFRNHFDVELDFQRLASAISLKPIENRRLLVTSAMSGEGKTTVTIGLAKALVDLGFRVLMVDADFHKAELTNTLVATTPPQEMDSFIEETEGIVTITPNLHLQTTQQRQTNIPALVKQGSFEKSIALAESRDNYDYIIIDSPPVGLTSEAALMAETISNVLFVVRPNVSESNAVYSSLEELEQHYAKILGLVVNGVEINSRPYNYNYSTRYLEPSKRPVEQN